MTKSWNAPEYLDDTLFHGLREFFGSDVVDYPRMWHMYGDSFGEGRRDITSIVGRGYTMYGMLEDGDTDRTDIESKIRTKYFDIVIMHPWYPNDLFQLVLENYPADRVVWVDGRDEQQIIGDCLGKGLYFKRELVQPVNGVFPISFGIPSCKIQQPLEKTRGLAHCIAGDTSTYIFKTENSYYNQYNESLVGLTKKKEGWDCMRHYEIMLSRCVPWFVDLAWCPETTCTTLPKKELLQINSLINQYGTDYLLYGKLRIQYNELQNKINKHFVENCTTSAMAKYLLNNIKTVN